MSAIFSNTLRSQKSRNLHQWKPENNGPVLRKVTILEHWDCQSVYLARDGQDGNGL